MTAFPDLKIDMDDLIEQRGKLIYKWILEGANSGPGGTGMRVHISGFEGDAAHLTGGLSFHRPTRRRRRAFGDARGTMERPTRGDGDVPGGRL